MASGFDFDMVPGEYEIRDGEPDYTGRIVVIGTDIHEHELEAASSDLLKCI